MMVLKIFPVIIVTALLTTNSFGQHSNNLIKDTDIDRIQIALLLDISGSMDKLIYQTKSQFWNIASYLNGATKNGKKPTIEIALITYGGLIDNQNSFTTIMSNFTSELDSLVDNLYRIKIGGSKEYCWTSINIALDQLIWSRKKGDLKILLIAGNESFDQGSTDPEIVIQKSRKLDVIINTIYCGTKEDPINASWKNAADLAKGSYFTIDLEDSLVMKESFMDKKLIDFNEILNSTYMPYGQNGEIGYNRMILQDKNARLTSMPFFRERVAYKASESYINPSWDFVDAFIADSTIIKRLGQSELPDELDSLNFTEMKHYLEDKLYTRQSYKEVILLRYQRIIKHLGEGKGKNSIDDTIKEIVNKEGKRKRFSFN